MKTIRQIHEEEQQEARYSEAHRRFMQTMDRIDSDHEAFLRSSRRAERWFNFAMVFLLSSVVLTITAACVRAVWR